MGHDYSTELMNELSAWLCNLTGPQMAFFMGALTGRYRNQPNAEFWHVVADIRASIGKGLGGVKHL